MSASAKKAKKPAKIPKKNKGNTYSGRDYGPVTWEELSNLRRNSVILFKSVRYPNKISEWTLRADHARESRYYICVLCRRLQDRGRREKPPVNFGPAARILVRNGRFLVHPDYPKTPHICGFAENPLSDRAAVLARRMMIRARAEITEDGLTAKQKMMQVIERFRTDEKYADLTDQEIAMMEEMCRGKVSTRGWSDSSTARALYINRRKLTSLKHCELRKIFECPIVGCSFVTTLQGMIDVHISETHKTADGDPEPSLIPHEGLYPAEECYTEESYLTEGACNGENGEISVTTPDQIIDEEGNDGKKDFGPVMYEAVSSRQTHGPIIIHYSKRYPDKISEWSIIWDDANNETVHYECVLCRRVIEKAKRSNSIEDIGPPAQISVLNGRFLVDPDYPEIPHVCNFAKNVLSNRETVLARRSSIRKKSAAAIKCEKIPEGELQGPSDANTTERWNMPCSIKAEGDNSKEVKPFSTSRSSQSSCCAEIDDQYLNASHEYPSSSNKPALGDGSAVSEVIRPTIHGPKRVPMKFIHRPIDASTLQRKPVSEVMETMHAEYSCSIVGCSFRTRNAKALDEHLQIHEILDEESSISSQKERAVYLDDECDEHVLAAASLQFSTSGVSIGMVLDRGRYEVAKNRPVQRTENIAMNYVGAVKPDTVGKFNSSNAAHGNFQEEPVPDDDDTTYEEMDDEIVLDVEHVDEEEFGDDGDEVAYEEEMAAPFEYKGGRLCRM